MATEPSTTTYELYFLEVRGWELSVRFPEHERHLALKAAKEAEAEGRAAKIVREVYYPRRHENEDTVAYLSRNVKEAQAALDRAAKKPKKKPGGGSFEDYVSSYTPPRSGETGRGGESAKESPEAAAARRQGASDLVMRVIAVGVGSTVLAGMASALASVFLNRLTSMGSGLSPGGTSAALFIIFIIAFVLAAIPLVILFIPLDEKRQGAYDRPWWMFASPQDVGSKTVREERPPPKEAPPAPLPKVEPVPEPEPEPEPEPVFELPEEPEDIGLEEDSADGAELAVEADQDTSAAMEKNRVAMMRFLGGAVSILKGSRPQLDPYNKFGVHLIIAGASDVLGELRNLDPEARLRLTQETLEVLGTKGNLARSFCDKLEEYTQTPRYLDMIQAGREAMNKILADDSDPYSELPKVMKNWNTPSAKNDSPSIITVMFTDMVGSTNITQARGDERAQVLVRTHNTIVRGALSEFSGREIKHTGDGIMASFGSAANAVEATIAIQRATIAQSQDLGLHLRIGLNAGEPIQEEDDLFGTTVQLAARICAKADTDQTLVSNVVRELCTGKPLRFIPRGAFELKGVTDPQPLYEVAWSADAMAAPAALNPTPAPTGPSPAPSSAAVESSSAPQPKLPPNPFARKK